MAARLGVTVRAIGVSVHPINMTIDAVNSIRDGVPCTDEHTFKSTKETCMTDKSASGSKRRHNEVK